MVHPPIPFHRQLVANAIRAARERGGMTQMDLSEASGVSQQFISLLENGKASVTVDTLNKLALALRVPIDTLLKSDDA